MERKIVKLRVDMYSDTKFKIIDTMEDRDVIHYIWTRLLTLAGKVNLEGDLYLSKNIPYTIETLALEFNRSAEKVRLALKVFMDLEMIELTEDNVYRVKNFAKHQNIKSKKKADVIEKEKCVGEKSDEIGFMVNKENIDDIDSAVDKSSCIDSILNKQIIENADNYVLEDKENVIESVVHNKCVKTTELSGSKDLRINPEVKNNNEEINKCIEFTGRINKSQFNNDGIVEKSKINNSKVTDFKSTPKTDIDLKDCIRIKDDMKIKDNNIDNSVLVEDLDKLEITNNTKGSVNKSSLDKNLLGNEVNLEEKVNVEKEFVLSKGSSKKKKRKPKKKDNDVYVISDWKDDDNIELCKDDDSTELCEDGKNNEELCEFGDKIPEGELVTVFKL